MTKDQLKIALNAPMRDVFLSEEDYIAAKTAWVDTHPEEYVQILVAPSEN